jgi:GAF domain-containing protein
MKFLENRSLKQLALYLAGIVLILFIVEFFIISGRLGALGEAQEKRDFARQAQLQGQQVSIIVSSLLSGREDVSADLYAGLNEQENNLKILNSGGRIPGKDLFIGPLDQLPRITYENLYSNWLRYREDVKSLLTNDSISDTASARKLETTETSSATTDSVITIADSLVAAEPVTAIVSVPSLAAATSEAAKLLPGQWLTISHWYERLLQDLTDEAQAKKNALQLWLLLSVLFDLLILGLLYYLFTKQVIKPLAKVQDNASKRLQDTIIKNNEVGALTREINDILEQLKDATDFVAAIGQGKLDFDYKVLDSEYAEGKNRLADSLIEMQRKLKTLNEEEQRRQWANEGLSKFVEILRSSNDNITQLSDKIISALVKYTNSNQGGLYILNDDDERNRYLELVSIFAFDIKKFEKQKVKLGEGILGQTFLEKETTVLNDVPQEYIRITSGLGGANPKSLLIVPLKVDKDVYGIVELASFRNYQPHEITFVEKLAETIASTLGSVKAAQKNRQLIEQFQQQTEEMRSQEEEMRQNMEELQATQEELSRKERDYIQRIEDLEREVASADLSKSEVSINEQEYQFKIRTLEQKLAELPARSDDWSVAEEVAQTLRFQIEALKITEGAAGKKS